MVGPINGSTPKNTFFLQNFNISNSYKGEYLLIYTIYKVGNYELYIRLKTERAPSFPI